MLPKAVKKGHTQNCDSFQSSPNVSMDSGYTSAASLSRPTASRSSAAALSSSNCLARASLSE